MRSFSGSSQRTKSIEASWQRRRKKMPGEICLINRQKTRSIDSRLLRTITRFLIEEHFRWPRYEFCLHLVTSSRMARVNEQFLNHTGSTDVITFDYSPPGPRDRLSGEAFICVDEAVR